MSSPVSVERGRPRNFDYETAVDAATAVFWSCGFQGASLAALTDAMGIGKTSMYAAFGDKEALYLLTLDHYLQTNLVKRAAALESESNVELAIRQFLQQFAKLFTDPELPGGCFVINGTADTNGSMTPPAVEKALRNAMRMLEKHLRVRLERAVRESQLQPDSQPADLAAFLTATLAGMAVLAKSGSALARLQTVIESAMQLLALRRRARV